MTKDRNRERARTAGLDLAAAVTYDVDADTKETGVATIGDALAGLALCAQEDDREGYLAELDLAIHLGALSADVVEAYAVGAYASRTISFDAFGKDLPRDGDRP